MVEENNGNNKFYKPLRTDRIKDLYIQAFWIPGAPLMI